MKLEPILLVQMNIFERNADKKDLSWPSFGDGRQVLGKRQVREQKPYVLACPTYPRTNWEYLPKHGHSISFKVTWLIGKVKAQCQRADVFKGWDWQGFTEVFICFYKYVNRIPTDFHRPPLYIGQKGILITKDNQFDNQTFFIPHSYNETLIILSDILYRSSACFPQLLKQSPGGLLQKIYSWRFCKIHRKYLCQSLQLGIL